jgi:hypothetical protein
VSAMSRDITPRPVLLDHITPPAPGLTAYGMMPGAASGSLLLRNPP